MKQESFEIRNYATGAFNVITTAEFVCFHCHRPTKFIVQGDFTDFKDFKTECEFWKDRCTELSTRLAVAEASLRAVLGLKV